MTDSAKLWLAAAGIVVAWWWFGPNEEGGILGDVRQLVDAASTWSRAEIG